jgi:capsule polysaccharide export protein KpsE/RkpR
MEDFFKSKSLMNILVRWKIHLVVIVGTAVILAAFFSSSIFITPLFKSYAILYPSNISAYADESLSEQALQVLNSKDIRDSLIAKFDLPHHYGIDVNYEYYTSTMLWEFTKNVKFTKTPYDAVTIEVWDKDPKVACDMVNEIMNQYNYVLRRLHKEKFREVVVNYRTVTDYKRKELDSLQLKSKELGEKYGLLDYPNQSREVMRAYLAGGGSGSRGGEVNRLKKNLEEHGGEKEMLSNLMTAITKDYSAFKLDYDRAVLDANRNFTYVNVLNKPFISDKKAYPVRWLIVVTAAFSVLFFSIIVIGIIEARRRRSSDAPSV